MPAACIDLPEDLWQRVLHFVPLRQRLGTCSLVEQKWRRAAAAATECVSLPHRFSAPSVAKEFQQWLASHYGQHVTSLKLSWLPDAFTQPCPNLCDLDLEHCHVHHAALHGCTGLTSCSLYCCTLHQAEEPFDNTLAALASLKHLVLVHYAAAAGAFLAPGSDTVLSFSGTVLQRLTQLTYLRLSWVKPEPLHQVSVLQHLQVLDVSGDGLDISATSTPGFSSLTALQRLGVGPEASLDPAVLHASTQLQDLMLADGCRILAPAGGGSSSGGGLSLLQLLPTLQHLSRLEVGDAVCEWPAADTAAAAQYAALVASPKLQELYLLGCHLSAGWAAAVFRPGRQLTSITALEMTGWDTSGGGGVWAHMSPPGLALDQPEVDSVASCCPELRSLSLAITHVFVDLDVLGMLSHLTQLCVDHMLDDSCLSLAALTRLRHLELVFPEPAPPDCVLPLTCLQQLTYLRVKEVTAEGWSPETQQLVLVSETYPGGVPVWLQLLQQMAEANTCCPGIVAQLAGTVQQLQEQNTEQEQQVAQLQGQVVEQQSQLASQGARLQALEGQVQQLLQALQHKQ